MKLPICLICGTRISEREWERFQNGAHPIAHGDRGHVVRLDYFWLDWIERRASPSLGASNV